MRWSIPSRVLIFIKSLAVMQDILPSFDRV